MDKKTFSTPVNKIPPQLLTSSTPPLSGTPEDKIPPHFLNSTTLWYPQWTKYLLTSSPPQLLTSSTPLLSGTPSGQNTSSPPQLHRSSVPPVDKIPPHLLNYTALWHHQWTKYLLTSSTPPLSGTSSGQNTCSPPLLSSATSGNTKEKNHYILLSKFLFQSKFW